MIRFGPRPTPRPLPGLRGGSWYSPPMTDAEWLARLVEYYQELWLIDRIWGPGPRPQAWPLPTCGDWLFRGDEERRQAHLRIAEFQEEEAIIERFWGPKLEDADRKLPTQVRTNPPE